MTRWIWVFWVPPTSDNTGRDPSARRLFRGYTFEVFWRNGFALLRSLDDAGDGKLTGRELDGLSVWFDRNRDGKSERAQVITLQDLHVAEIATLGPRQPAPPPFEDAPIRYPSAGEVGHFSHYHSAAIAGRPGG